MSLLKSTNRTNVQNINMLVQTFSEKLLLEPNVMKDYFNSLFMIKSKKQLEDNMKNFIGKKILV